MKIKTDLHVHTTYCDGKNTPEEMIRAALQKGMSCIGFSGHGYTPFDPGYCMSPQAAAEYRAEIAALKEKYAGRIRVLCGMERDYYTEESAEGCDYVIGSVHYVKIGADYPSVDESAENARENAARYFGGDWYAMAEAYYDTLAGVVQTTGADIVGHFDLIAKYNGDGTFFDEAHPRYVAAWKRAADALLREGRPFEINTGALTRGYRAEPYPARPIRDYLRARGAKFILSSDAHGADALCAHFEEYEDEASDPLTLLPFLCG